MTTVFVCSVNDIDESCGVKEIMEVLGQLQKDRDLLRRLNLVLVTLEFSKYEEYEIRYAIARTSDRILRNQDWLVENELDEQGNRVITNE